MYTLPLLLIACTPSLPDAEQRAAQAYCDRALECGTISEADWDACSSDMRDIVDLIWPDSRCTDHVDRQAWYACLDAIDALSCDQWAWDVLTRLGDCAADKVCSG